LVAKEHKKGKRIALI